jgi:hypothetical protein
MKLNFIFVLLGFVVDLAPGTDGRSGTLAATPEAAGRPSPVVHGRVVDSTGAPLAGAALSLRRDADSFLASARSGPDGCFSIEAADGEFEVAATASGFSVARARVSLPGDGGGALELRLEPGVFTEAVTVVGTRLAGSPETLERLPGSVEIVDRHQLEASHVANVNEALHKATGVNVRDEEGLALRPNIGIRGLNPTRSSKTRCSRTASSSPTRPTGTTPPTTTRRSSASRRSRSSRARARSPTGRSPSAASSTTSRRLRP